MKIAPIIIPTIPIGKKVIPAIIMRILMKYPTPLQNPTSIFLMRGMLLSIPKTN
jgi:hypothetical protein